MTSADWLWAVVGLVVGAPISAAVPVLLERTGQGVPLSSARLAARAQTNWGVGKKLARRIRAMFPVRPASTEGEDLLPKILLVVVATILVVAAFVANAIAIATVMFAIAAATLVVTLAVFLVLNWARAFSGRRTAVEMVLTVVYAGIGVTVAVWLIEPPLHGVLGPARSSLDEHGAVGVVPFAGPLILQIIGAAVTYLLLLASIGLCMANMSAALLAVRTWGQPIWRFVFWAGRATTGRGAVVWLVALAVGSLGFTSGLAFEGFERLQAWLQSL